MDEREDARDEVGYKRPPRRTQFKRGQSGNPKGRSKGSKNFATALDKELRTAIAITENGKRKRISKGEAIVKQTVNKAVGGDPKAASLIFNETRLREGQTDNAVSAGNDAVVRPEDHLVLESIVRRIRENALTLDEQHPSLEPESGQTPSACETEQESK
jgi:hypothetical protein